jgi:glutamate-1-semialdehyde aminotransferase
MHADTFNGSAACVAAALATLDALEPNADALYARFCAAMLELGIHPMSVGRWCISFSHTDEDVDRTIDVARTAWRHARSATT